MRSRRRRCSMYPDLTFKDYQEVRNTIRNCKEDIHSIRKQIECQHPSQKVTEYVLKGEKFKISKNRERKILQRVRNHALCPPLQSNFVARG